MIWGWKGRRSRTDGGDRTADAGAAAASAGEDAARGRLRPGFVMRQVAGRTVIVATGEASRTFQGMIRVNGTGEAIWRGLAEGLDDGAIVERLVAVYEVDRETAARDVAGFVDQARSHGFLRA